LITLAPILAVDALAGAALNGDAAGAGATDGADAFSDVLAQLMGKAPGEGAGVDLPLEDEGELPEEAELDELVNANVVDLVAQPIHRLVSSPTWALTDTTATPVAVTATVDPVVVERSVSAPTMVSQFAGVEVPALAANAPLPAATEPAPVATVPTPVATVPTPVATVPTLAATMSTATAAAPTPPAGVPAGRFGASLPELSETAGMPHPPAADPAASPATTTVTAAADTPPTVAAKTTPGTAMPLPATPDTPPAAATNLPATAVPTQESVARDVVPAPVAERENNGKADKADKGDKAAKHDPSRAFRVTAEAGQRAYAAAASGESKQETPHGFSEARHDARPAAEPSAAAGAPAVPFQVIERPAPAIAAVLAAPAAITAETIEAVVATELPAQVVQSVRMQAINGGGEAIVRLNPEYLGELVVAVKVENGAVSAALQSDTPAVRKWVESNEATLRQALAEHGLQLDRLTVSKDAPPGETGDRPREEGREPEHESQPHPRRQRKPAPDATFEVVV